MQAALAAAAIGWGAYQLASKIRQKVGEGNKLGSKAVVKEIVITLGSSVISFLTGGIADAVPDLFGIFEGVSKAVSKGTEFGTAEGVNMAGDAQSMNIGAVANGLELFRDLAECCNPVKGTCKCPDSAKESDQARRRAYGIDGATISVNNRGAIDDLTLPANTNEGVHVTYTTSGSVKDENDKEVGFVIMDDPTLATIL